MALPNFSDLVPEESVNQTALPDFSSLVPEQASAPSTKKFEPDNGPGAGEVFGSKAASAFTGLSQTTASRIGYKEMLKQGIITKKEFDEKMAPGGESEKYAQSIEDAADRKHAGPALLGEATGFVAQTAASGPVAELALQGAGTAVKSVAQKGGKVLSSAADTLGEVADKMSTATFKLSDAAAKRIERRLGVTGLQDFGELMRDKMVTGTKSTMVGIRDAAEGARKAVGQTLGRIFTLLDKEIPVLSKSTKPQLVIDLAEDATTRAKTLKELSKLDSFKNLEDTADINPSELWKIKQELNELSGRFRRAEAPAAQSRADFLDNLSTKVEQLINKHVDEVLPIPGEEPLRIVFDQANREYAMLKEASDAAHKVVRSSIRGAKTVPTETLYSAAKNIAVNTQPVRQTAIKTLAVGQEALDAAANLLSKGEALGPYYKKLTGVLKHGGLQAVVKWHAYERRKNSDYNELVKSLDLNAE